MRVSTGMIFDSGVATIRRQTATLLHTQQQVSSGRRLITPADDPVAAARALEVTQAREVNAQYRTNQDNARTALGLMESQLQQVQNLIQDMQERAVQAGNGALSDKELGFIASEARARFAELLGVANATDGTGRYLFSGYKGDTKPFSGTVELGVTYAGDDGQRGLQVSAARQLPVSDSGADVFGRIRNGNGVFAADFNTNNTGSGVIDAGSVLGSYNGHSYTLTFANGGAGLEYSVADTDPVSGAVTNSGPFAYASGAPIDLGGAASIRVSITGTPAAGDVFTVGPARSDQSIFDTIADFIGALEAGKSTAQNATALNNRVGQTLGNLSLALDNVLTVRASVGTRLVELDALSNSSEDLGLQYEQTLSRLQDVDYAQAISDLTRQQANLEAAQTSFVRVSGLSLFDYLR